MAPNPDTSNLLHEDVFQMDLVEESPQAKEFPSIYEDHEGLRITLSFQGYFYR